MQELVAIRYHNISNRSIDSYAVTYGVPLCRGDLKGDTAVAARLADGRLNNRCGMSVAAAVPSMAPQPGEDDGDEAQVRCPACGVMGRPPVCRDCGAPIRDPEEE